MAGPPFGSFLKKSKLSEPNKKMVENKYDSTQRQPPPSWQENSCGGQI